MAEFKQTCKQCGLELPVEEFKQYTSRSEGIRRTTVGRYTICKHCEKLSTQAAKLQKRFESGNATEIELQEREALRNYYRQLVDRGLPLVTAPVRRLMGVADEPKKRGAKSKVLTLIAEAGRRAECAAKQEAARDGLLHRAEDKIDREVQAAVEDIAKDYRYGNLPINAAVTEAPFKIAEQSPVGNSVWGANEVIANAELPVPTPPVDVDTIMKALDILNDLLECEFVREPEYYEAVCDDALQVLRNTTEDGKVPSAYTALASQVLERLDEYADTYEG